MTRYYPECDSYECEGCPREPTCDLKDVNEVLAPVIDETQARLDNLEQELAIVKELLWKVARVFERAVADETR